MAKKQKDLKGRDGYKGSVNLSGITTDDRYPQMAIYALDRSGKPIGTTSVGDDGLFKISASVLAKAHRIAIGPRVKDISTVDRKILTLYRPGQFQDTLEASGVLEVPKKYWCCWHQVHLCMSGSVKKCSYPVYYSKQALLKTKGFAYENWISDVTKKEALVQSVSDFEIAKSYQQLCPVFRCEKICDGYIEVYRRFCCCHPWIIYDPRIPQLVYELEEILYDPPKVKWPPRPEPDPLPFEKIAFFKHGALDKKIANAKQDLYAIKTLPPLEAVEYIKVRPYLWNCNCGPSYKVADGFIRPDGEFHICWWEWPRLMTLNCYEEYAFKIKQNIDGSTLTIYDGVAAKQWYKYGDHADLVSYHPDALTCRESFPGDGAFALLQDIGQTGSWRLKTPDATGWDRVNTPVYNDGLSYPAANAAAAKGKWLDRNWGGTLKLRYHFSEDMKGIGAKYYRISVVAADANGNPTGSRTYLSPNEWRYYEVISPDIFVRKIALGPNSAGGENQLFKIPYDADYDWQSGQYHAMLDTTKFANGRFLLTVEVFNSSGKLIRPTGTPDPGGSVQKAFTYRRWYQETGPTAEVPFAALTHMLWWDNRRAEALIEDFRVDGFPNIEECQFLENKATANFSVGYRAYHPEPMFMWNHVLWCRRGLKGASKFMNVPSYSPDNVGVPPSLPFQSGSKTFSEMLGTHSKCTFSVNLHTNVKTFNGISNLSGLDDWDQASMALGIE